MSSLLTPAYEIFDKKLRDFVLVVVYGLNFCLRQIYHCERKKKKKNPPLLSFAELDFEIVLLRFVLLSLVSQPSLNSSSSLLILQIAKSPSFVCSIIFFISNIILSPVVCFLKAKIY